MRREVAPGRKKKKEEGGGRKEEGGGRRGRRRRRNLQGVGHYPIGQSKHAKNIGHEAGKAGWGDIPRGALKATSGADR